MGCPEPGIYHDVPYEEYASWEAMNASLLCEAFFDDGLSMQRLKAVIDGRLKREQTDALRFGRALHTRLLEPSLFDAQWQASRPCSQIMGSGKRAGEPCGAPGWKTNGQGLWLCGKHHIDGYTEPENYLDAGEAARIEEIRRRLLMTPKGRNLHRLKGAEVSIVFEACSVRCKARLDKYGPGNGVIPDIKKVAAGRLTQYLWERTVEERHYDVRAAFYVDGIRSLTGEDNEFWWLACEDDEPFHVAVIRCTDDVLAIGRHKYQQALDSYRRCLESDTWPSPFPDLISSWELPRHVIYQHEQMGVIASRKGL